MSATLNCLVGLVVRVSDLKIGTPVATLPGTTGSALGLVGQCQCTVLGEVESLICNFYLSVAVHKII